MRWQTSLSFIIYCLNCFRRDRNSTYKTGLTHQSTEQLTEPDLFVGNSRQSFKAEKDYYTLKSTLGEGKNVNLSEKQKSGKKKNFESVDDVDKRITPTAYVEARAPLSYSDILKSKPNIQVNQLFVIVLWYTQSGITYYHKCNHGRGGGYPHFSSGPIL